MRRTSRVSSSGRCRPLRPSRATQTCGEVSGEEEIPGAKPPPQSVDFDGLSQGDDDLLLPEINSLMNSSPSQVELVGNLVQENMRLQMELDEIVSGLGKVMAAEDLRREQEAAEVENKNNEVVVMRGRMEGMRIEIERLVETLSAMTIDRDRQCARADRLCTQVDIVRHDSISTWLFNDGGDSVSW